jgi:hypothetical protein
VIPDSLIRPISIVSSILLVGYLLRLLWDLYSPRGRCARDASAGGCLGMVAVIVSGLVALLAVGFIFHIHALIWGICVLPIIAVLVLAPEIIWMKIKSLRENKPKR